jgi:hypothetical protein
VLNEVIELLQAKTVKEFLEELCDIYTNLLLVIYVRFGLDFPVVWKLSANKYMYRAKVWRDAFNQSGIEFDIAYLQNGSNYEKIDKIRKAYNLARGK